MKRSLQILNLLGVLLLAALCIAQWQANRRLNLDAIVRQAAMDKQAAKIAEQETALQGAIADLNDFRSRLVVAQDAINGGDARLQAVVAEKDRLAAERDQLQTTADTLKKSLDQWTVAVSARDAALKKADVQLESLARDRNDAVAKFNDLAVRYNSAADQIKQASAQLQKLAEDRNNVAKKFNELAARYNALQAPPAATRP